MDLPLWAKEAAEGKSRMGKGGWGVEEEEEEGRGVARWLRG